MPVPPTFFFSLVLIANPSPFAYLAELDVDMRHVLHGEQRFSYIAMAHAGDTLTLTERITDVTSKRAGALEILVKQTDITRGGDPIAQATSTVVVRHPEMQS